MIYFSCNINDLKARLINNYSLNEYFYYASNKYFIDDIITKNYNIAKEVKNESYELLHKEYRHYTILGNCLFLDEDCGLYNELFIPDLLYTTFPYEYTYNILMREFCEASELS